MIEVDAIVGSHVDHPMVSGSDESRVGGKTFADRLPLVGNGAESLDVGTGPGARSVRGDVDVGQIANHQPAGAGRLIEGSLSDRRSFLHTPGLGSTVEHTVEGASEIDGRFDHHSLSAPGR
jgi:hypothetical protein